MSRKREAVFMGIGILTGLALCGPASAAVQQLTAVPTSQTFYVDGQRVQFEAYEIHGNNFVKLRDIGKSVDFGVTYDIATNTVHIAPGSPYIQEVTAPAQTIQPTPTPSGLEEDAIHAALLELRDVYPTNTLYGAPYVPNNPLDRPYSNCDACAGWAMKCSDTAFGTLPWRRVMNPRWEDIRVGDLLDYRTGSTGHVVVVLEKRDDMVIVTESGRNDRVRWGGQYPRWWLEQQSEYSLRTRYRIGRLYAAGLGTEQDYEEAALWLEKSADAGYKYAQYTLAGLYRDAKGVEQDYAAALELYTKASSSPYAAYELGKLYRDGLGCAIDADRAEWYFRQAFTGFQVMAQRAQDEKLQYRIGWMLLHGVGTDPDEAAALPWLGKSADRGNTFAKYALGKLLLCGETIPRNVDRALDLLTECAEAGNQYAQYTLGKAYLLGQDIPQDQTEAVHWLKLSAEQGNQYAQYFLDRFYGSIFSSATSLLYHMGNIFQEQRQPPSSGMRVAVDSKLKQKIREKKIAMGHKPDDHEEQTME